MRLPAMLLVAFSLVLSAVANPFPAIATENANTFDVDFMQKLSITWCFDPDHHCLAIDQEARTCTYHKDFANLKGIGMDIGIYCDVFPNPNCDTPGVKLGNTVDVPGSGADFPILSTWCWDSRIGGSHDMEIDNDLPARLNIEFCWAPGVESPDCQVLTHENQHCHLEQYLFGLKSVHVTDTQTCILFPDDNCKATDKMVFVGNTDDIRAAGVNFSVQSSWCYDLALGPVDFTKLFNKRSIHTIDSATFGDSKDTVKLSNSIASQQNERLVARDSSSTSPVPPQPTPTKASSTGSPNSSNSS